MLLALCFRAELRKQGQIFNHAAGVNSQESYRMESGGCRWFGRRTWTGDSSLFTSSGKTSSASEPGGIAGCVSEPRLSGRSPTLVITSGCDLCGNRGGCSKSSCPKCCGKVNFGMPIFCVRLQGFRQPVGDVRIVESRREGTRGELAVGPSLERFCSATRCARRRGFCSAARCAQRRRLLMNGKFGGYQGKRRFIAGGVGEVGIRVCLVCVVMAGGVYIYA
jgi:hypothetical protein